MMLQYVAICAIAAVQFAAATETMEAAGCVGRFTLVTKSCESISAFAKCLALTNPSDQFLNTAENALADAQKGTNCDLRVTPSIKVVDRELRVVTQEDVKFQRFRRDEVGVFQLKEMIDANTDQLKEKIDATKMTDALTESANTAKTVSDELDAKIDAAAVKIDAVDSKCEANILAANTKITKLQGAVDTINEEAEKAAATEVEVAASWQFLSNPIQPTNRRESVGIIVVGKNFKQYDYHPHPAPFFKCTFTLASDTSKKVVTTGQTARIGTETGASFDVSCPSPVSIALKSVFQLSVSWTGGEKPLEIPFNGAKGKDSLMFDMTWSTLKKINGRVVVDVSGLNVNGKYVCVFTQPDNRNIRKTADAAFLDDVGRQLDCGPQPTGFAITGTTAAAIFELMVKGTQNKASYAGAVGAGPTVEFNTCTNGIKDGEETDKDCGGLCGGCLSGKACKVKKDCADDIKCANNKCAPMDDGKSKEAPGESCASILKLHPGSKDGLYWIDPDGKGDPFQVYCDQTNKGGGWILLQHTRKVAGNYPCSNNAYTQSWADWENKGIGSVTPFDNVKADALLSHSNCQWQPFKNWGRIVGFSDKAGVISEMNLVSSRGWNAALIMKNFYVDSRERYKYGLRMSNYDSIKRDMCGQSDNCFASPYVGFSTHDRDRDNTGGACSDPSGGVGWWFAMCYHHHQTHKGISQAQFDGCQTRNIGNCGTQHWSWYVK